MKKVGEILAILKRAAAPGIRLKLSFFTGLFVSTVLITATSIHYFHQKKILEEGFASQIEPSLRYINSVVDDFENIKSNMILIEEMKLRIRDKSRELRQYKRLVYRKKSSFFNDMKMFGEKIGLRVKYDYVSGRIDTPYSVYLSEKDIADLEKTIKSMLRDRSGRPADDGEFKRLQRYAAVCAYHQRGISSAAERIRDLETAKRKLRTAMSGFQYQLRPYYRYHMQKLEETGIHGENIRIISSDTAGNVSYDTGIHLNEAALRFAALLNDSGYTENRKKFYSMPEEGSADSADYLIDGRSISSSMRTVYKNPSTWQRLKSVISESEKKGYQWKKFIEGDIVYSGRISEVVVSLKARASELDNKKAGYLNDAVYRGLYKKYQMILDERDKSFAALNPYRDYEKKMNKLYRDDLAAVDRRINEITSSISVLRTNQKKYMERSDDIQIEIDDLTEHLAQMKSDAADLKKDYISRSEQLGLSEELRAADSFRYLRDAALYDYMQIKYGSGAGSLREYMSSSGVRVRHRARWRTVRNWVVSGSGETGFPQYVSGYKGLKTIDSGVLAFGRSEVERYMWFLDSTPIASEVTLAGFSPGEDSLSAYLQRELVTGYNEVLIDKSDGIKRVERNTAMLLYYSVFLAVLSVALTYFFAGMMVKRIRGIIAEAKRVRGGQLDVVFPQKGMDEIEDLGASLNAMMTGLREKEQLKSELYAAGELQKQLLPDKLPSNLDRFYTIGSYYMAMQGVGGDYYDFIELDADRLFFCIGDVSNHGVGPAIVMSMLRAHLHGIINRGKCDIKEIMLELNSMIYYDTPHHIFVTFFSGIIDKTDNSIVYGSAGHPRSIVYRYKSSSIEVLEGGGLPLGMDDNDFFEDTITIEKIKLMPGDLFFQYTDGLTESMNDAREQFGDDRLHNLISENSKKKIDILIRKISESVNLFSGVDPDDPDGKKPGDDMAMIAVKRIK